MFSGVTRWHGDHPCTIHIIITQCNIVVVYCHSKYIGILYSGMCLIACQWFTFSMLIWYRYCLTFCWFKSHPCDLWFYYNDFLLKSKITYYILYSLTQIHLHIVLHIEVHYKHFNYYHYNIACFDMFDFSSQIYALLVGFVLRDLQFPMNVL